MAFKKGQSGNPSGRPRTAEKHERAIASAEKRIADRLPFLVDKAFELADGVYIEEKTPDGKLIYQRPPDFKSIAYLIDRIMGKPTERKEITGDAGAPLFPDFERALQKTYADDTDQPA